MSVQGQAESGESTAEDISPSESGRHERNYKRRGVLSRISRTVTKSLENSFDAHGKLVVSHPASSICVCLALTVLSSIGIFWFKIEIRPFRLWISQESDFMEALKWQAENFPIQYRRHVALWEAENILTAEGVRAMWSLHSQVLSIRDETFNNGWEDSCVRVPSVVSEDGSFELRKKRNAKYAEEYSMGISRSLYCQVLEDLPALCMERSLLEVWGLDASIINNLTDEQVVNDVNNAVYSKVFGYETDFKALLGGISTNASGHIVSAKYARHMWMTHVNETLIANGMDAYDMGTGFLVDKLGLSFEDAWIKTVLKFYNTSLSVRAVPNAASSFGEVSEANLQSDLPWVALGFALMLTYVSLSIGNKNTIQQRILLSMAGLFGIVQACAITYGLCSYIGIAYTPVNSILPLLMVGLGVDDMFVIMAAWESITGGKNHLDPIERAGQTMRHAGVAITVTSVTDVVAFLVGATTSLPALRSFCLYAAIGILTVYFMQITFFVAMIPYVERIQPTRAGIIPCLKESKTATTECGKIKVTVLTFELLSKYLFSRIGKCVTMLTFSLVLSFSIWGTSNLERRSDPMLFLPSDSYLFEWHAKENLYFHNKGNEAFLFISDVNLPRDITQIQQLLDKLESLFFIQETSSVFTEFISYYNHHPNFKDKELTDETFKLCLSLFLNSKTGASFKNNFKFEEALNCDTAAPKATSIRLDIKFETVSYAADQAKAKVMLKDVLSGFNFTGYKGLFSESFLEWETNEIVGDELATNMLLVLVIVFLISLLFLASFWGAVLVFFCVVSTELSIGGLMWLFGLAVDTVSCIGIILSVGLSVDYGVHVVHSYLKFTEDTSANERVKKTLNYVGPAVFQGGFSTLVAFLIMAPSTSHVFQTFFKIFSGSAVFGMLWGLIVLPVILSFTFVISFPAEISNINGRLFTRRKNSIAVEKNTGIQNDCCKVDE